MAEVELPFVGRLTLILISLGAACIAPTLRQLLGLHSRRVQGERERQGRRVLLAERTRAVAVPLPFFFFLIASASAFPHLLPDLIVWSGDFTLAMAN